MCSPAAAIELRLTNSDRPALVSAGDFERVLAFSRRWRVERRPGRLPYVVCRKNGKRVMLHRLVLDAWDYRRIDHRDGDRYNNTRENLRWTTSRLNARNTPPYRKRAERRSVYKGVSWHKRNGMWQAQVHTLWNGGPKAGKGRTVHLGYSRCEMCAALLYDNGARRLFGSEWSRTNFSEGMTCATCGNARTDG